MAMRISITVYDDHYKKIFSMNKMDLQSGMYQLSGFVNAKLGMPLKVVNTKGNGNGNTKKCYVCGKPIKKGTGMVHSGKNIHQFCLMAARQQLP